MIVLGLSSGTSADGIDVAAGDFRLDGELVRLTPLGHQEHEYSRNLRQAIMDALPPGTTTMEAVCRLDTLVGSEFAEAACFASKKLLSEQAELVASHGQTLYHWVEGSSVLGTLQLGQPAWIAEATGLPVVSNIRTADIAAGGQGAPLAGVLDTYLLADRGQAAALNLGGIANVTIVKGTDSPLAFDTGPGNVLLDAAVERVTGGAERADVGGRRAARGVVVETLLSTLLEDPYYRRLPPKSTGKERFHRQYLDTTLARLPEADELADADLLATLTELTAVTVADALHPYAVHEVFASGGGARNPELMRRIAANLAPVRLRPVDDLGLDACAKEAYLFALIGFLTWNGLPGTLPTCTGARRSPIAGSITPGHAPLRLPEPAVREPEGLRVDRPRT